MISMIAAVGKNGEMGKNGDLVFNIKEDMKFFRETTSGHTVIMGRKTYVSFPGPLKNRKNVVLSRTPDLTDDRVDWVTDIKEALSKYTSENEEVFIIGGAAIYEQFLPFCDRIFLTEIDAEANADTFFPEFNKALFKKTKIKELDDENYKAEVFLYERL